jgi:hypothetical protein
LKRYEVEIDGNKTTLLLSEADAAARGLTVQAEPAVTTKARTPANKGRKPATKRAEAAEQAFGAKASDEE